MVGLLAWWGCSHGGAARMVGLLACPEALRGPPCREPAERRCGANLCKPVRHQAQSSQTQLFLSSNTGAGQEAESRAYSHGHVGSGWALVPSSPDVSYLVLRRLH